ncbi:hypothetical protein [Aquibium sp. ELW1220]|uniref:hypothetical protein n=1 Tax=Aquibium sp. ELW1220 TaxID=2976766 RepID=UPI0025B1692C|nr:hypothetical protein [Aquibium sp. ELW1220]MDN2581211.1 hypothetical protein [Aquibium sp. ELW1220]
MHRTSAVGLLPARTLASLAFAILVRLLSSRPVADCLGAARPQCSVSMSEGAR